MEGEAIKANAGKKAEKGCVSFESLKFGLTIFCSPHVFSSDAQVILRPFRDFGRHSACITSPFIDFMSVFICGSIVDGKLNPVEDDDNAWGSATPAKKEYVNFTSDLSNLLQMADDYYYKIALKALPDFRQTLDDLCSYCKDDADSITLRVLTIISELVSSISMMSLILIILFRSIVRDKRVAGRIQTR